MFAAALLGGIVLRYTVDATPVPIAPTLRLVCGLAGMARYLSEKFGAAYAAFVERVPRYL